MTEEFKNIVRVTCIYVTTIIGAGFASGQEIARFFSTYYRGGFYGIILAGLLFALIGWLVLDKVYTQRIRNYDEFLFPTVGWFLGWVMQLVVSLFMLSLFSIMIAGLGRILTEKTGIPFSYSVVIMAFACAVIIIMDIRGIIAVSTLVTPVMIAGILIIGLYVISCRDAAVFSTAYYFRTITDNWFFSSLLYVSYNSIMSVVMMCSLFPYLKTRRVGVVGGIAGGGILCLIAIILNIAICLFYPQPLSAELPVLGIVQRFSSAVSWIYSIVLFLAMLTSAVTSGYCFIDRIKGAVHVNTKVLTLIITAIAIPMSSLGFSSLISTLYPIFGYAGLFMILAILMQAVRWKPVPVTLRKHNK